MFKRKQIRQPIKNDCNVSAQSFKITRFARVIIAALFSLVTQFLVSKATKLKPVQVESMYSILLFVSEVFKTECST